MLRILVFALCLPYGYHAHAFQNDTSAYQTQRLKINSLLVERSTRFGQYDLSLNARSGIFGLQTKKDLRNSNEILRSIILNDNNIFRELKVLMNYKDQEVAQVQDNVSNNRKRIDAYMQTIKKLQDKNELLHKQIDENSAQEGKSSFVFILLIAALVSSLAYIVLLHRKMSRSNLKS